MIIPDSVLTVEDSAFIACTFMTNVTIGSNVAYIGVNAFDNCSSLWPRTRDCNFPSISRPNALR